MHSVNPESLLAAHHVEHRLLVEERSRSSASSAPLARLRRHARAAYIAALSRALVRARAAQARSAHPA